ncbi:MAG: ATP-binding protein [Solirubrobacteraceae bacterium]
MQFRLELPSRPESVTLVRAALSALAEASGLEDELIDDLKTAVSEACNNVVLHAYPGGSGPLIMSVASGSGVNVTVEDRGTGIRQVAPSDQRMGVGLAVMSALADRAEFESSIDGGTTVRMSFKRRRTNATTVAEEPWCRPEPHQVMPDTTAQTQARRDIDLVGDVVVWLSPASSLAPVLGRLIRAAAATSHFTLGAVSDLHAIGAELGAYAERNGDGGPIGFSIDAAPRRLQLTGGPFLPPEGARAEHGQAEHGQAEHGQAAPEAVAGERRLASFAAELRTLHGAKWHLLQIELVDHSRDLVDRNRGRVDDSRTH